MVEVTACDLVAHATRLSVAVERLPAELQPGDRVIGSIDTVSEEIRVDLRGPEVVVKTNIFVSQTVHYDVDWTREGEPANRGRTSYGAHTRLLVCVPSR